MAQKFVSILIPEINNQCILASLNGKGFISDTYSMISNQKKGKKIFNLKSDDSLIKVLNYDNDLIATTNNSGRLLIFNVDSLPFLQKGVGVQLMKLKVKDFLSDIQLINEIEGLFWQTGSKRRQLKDINYWLGKRSQSGKKVPKYFNKNFKFNC